MYLGAWGRKKEGLGIDPQADLCFPLISAFVQYLAGSCEVITISR